MKNSSKDLCCELCGQPFVRGTSAAGREIFICINNKCPAQRLSRIELRLEAIEKVLEISPVVEEKIISVPEKVEVPVVPTEVTVIDRIRTLPILSLEEGKTLFYSLIDQLESRDKLNSLLEQTANDEYASPQFLREWAILMAYSGKTFMAAQRILKEREDTETPLAESPVSNIIETITCIFSRD